MKWSKKQQAAVDEWYVRLLYWCADRPGLTIVFVSCVMGLIAHWME
jgi:hypothetical protein